MQIELLIKKYQRMSGLARYAMSLCQGMRQIGVPFSQIHPTYPWIIRSTKAPLKRVGFDLSEFFGTFPLAAPLSTKSVKHFTNQHMATLFFSQRGLKRTVVTVHDILPYLLRHDKEQSSYNHPIERLFDTLSLMGLKKADAIIAISEFTKKTLVEAFSLPAEQIEVIPYGLDQELFRVVPVSQAFRTRHSLPADERYLLYVGSEAPRKNLTRLIQAFSLVKSRLPDVKLIKVGTPQYSPQYEQLLRLIDDLSLADDILFCPHPSAEELTCFYNVADLFVFPSLYEGFGLPPLEAMGCGTPVVTSNQSSLPEVVGDAAILVDPYDVEAIADGMMRVLSDKALAASLRQKGLERAKSFSWERTARQTLGVYERVLGEK